MLGQDPIDVVTKLWPMIVAAGGVIGSWATQRAHTAALRGRMGRVEQQLRGVQRINVRLARALEKLDGLDRRLERIEDRLDNPKPALTP